MLVAEDELPDALPIAEDAGPDGATDDQEPTLGERVAALHLDEFDQVRPPSCAPASCAACSLCSSLLQTCARAYRDVFDPDISISNSIGNSLHACLQQDPLPRHCWSPSETRTR